ncbi:hypothetical protein Leryth_025245 [Lithospermum erythrorhizon]|nr:hypothetical protein Leryth_025245 [Lithospermum erythrorhizon]
MDFKLPSSKAFAFFSIGSLLALVTQIVYFSPISSPEILQLPPPSTIPSNSLLQGVKKLGEGFLKKPEDVTVDENTGILYTSTRDGWVKRLHRNGSLEDWKWVGSETMLGLSMSADGGVIVCDSQQGLLKVNDESITNIASYVNGTKISFADDVIEASDGSLYFSVGSTKFQLHNWYLDVLEAKPHGQLLKYDPLLNETTILLNDLGFANGVALSQDEQYLVICESWKFRCLKYWLKGQNTGRTEIFINLPRAPDNINLAPDGSFWIALLEVSPSSLNFIHKWRVAKHLIASFPNLIEVVNGVHSKAMVMKVAPDGRILRTLDDPEGKVMSFVTSAVEYEGNLYLGSLKCDFIGKLQLEAVHS